MFGLDEHLIGRIFEIDVQMPVIAPGIADHVGFKAQIGAGFPGHAQADGVGQTHGAVQIGIEHRRQMRIDKSELLVPTRRAVDVEGHAAAVGQAGGPLVVEAHVQREVGAQGSAHALELGAVVGRSQLIMLFQGHVAAGKFNPRRDGNMIVDFPRDVGVDGNGVHHHVGHARAARPVAGKAVAQAETGENAHAQPQAVRHLVGGVKVRQNPVVLFGVGVGGFTIHAGFNAARGQRQGGAEHQGGARQLGDAGRIVGHGRGVVRAGDHAAGQRHAARAPFGNAETFGAGAGGGDGQHQGRADQGSEVFHARFLAVGWGLKARLEIM